MQQFYSKYNTVSKSKIGGRKIEVVTFPVNQSWRKQVMRAEVIKEVEKVLKEVDELNSKSIEELDYYFKELHGLLQSKPEGVIYKGLTYIYDRQSNKIIFTGFTKAIDAWHLDSLTCLGERIAAEAFKYHSIKQLRLPYCEALPDEAFDDSYDMESLEAPRCRYVGKCAFKDCGRLVEIDLDACEYISDSAFSCRRLEVIKLSNCLYIGDRAFQDCGKLRILKLPKCKYIGEDITNSNKLRKLKLPECVYIGKGNMVEIDELIAPKCEFMGEQSKFEKYIYYNKELQEYNFKLKKLYAPKCRNITESDIGSLGSVKDLTLPWIERKSGN